MEPDRPSALQAPNNSARVACKTTVSGSHLRGRLSWPWGYLSVCLGANENWSTVCIFQYAQLTPSTWVITVLREFVTSLRNLAATTWASLSGGWSWSSGNHSSCGESSGGCERASVRDWLLEALFFLPGDHRETDSKSWTCPIPSRTPASVLPSPFQAQPHPSLPGFLPVLGPSPWQYCLGF